MLGRKRQLNYFSKHWEKIFHHLYLFEHGREFEQLHHLRVEVKKVRVLLLLQENYSKEKFDEINSIIDPIFHKAGRIRTDVNYLKFAQKLGIDNAKPIKELEHKIENYSEKFQSETQQFFNVLAKCPPIIIKKIHPLKNTVTNNLEKHYYKKINKHLHQMDDPRKFHKARKQLKIVLYFHSLIPSSLSKQNGVDVKYIDKLQDEIGKWHDAYAGQAFLKRSGIKNPEAHQKAERSLNLRVNKLKGMTKKFKEQYYLS